MANETTRRICDCCGEELGLGEGNPCMNCASLPEVRAEVGRAGAGEGEALKPCAHCGGEGNRDGDGMTFYFIFCIKCGTATATSETEAEAIAAWNRRAHAPATDGDEALARVDALLEELDGIARKAELHEDGLPLYNETLKQELRAAVEAHTSAAARAVRDAVAAEFAQRREQMQRAADGLRQALEDEHALRKDAEAARLRAELDARPGIGYFVTALNVREWSEVIPAIDRLRAELDALRQGVRGLADEWEGESKSIERVSRMASIDDALQEAVDTNCRVLEQCAERLRALVGGKEGEK